MSSLSEHYPQEAALEAHVPASGRVAIDVGCNDGRWAAFLADRFHEVHAIDPQPGCASAVRGRGLGNVRMHCYAAWSNIGRLMFRSHRVAGGLNQGTIAGVDEFIRSEASFDYYEVPCQPLDVLLGHVYGVDFLKMDVDGAEVHAMTGAQAILRRDRPNLLIETHTNEARAWLSIWLPKLGYQPRVLSEPLFTLPDRYTDTTAYLFAPRPEG